MNTLKIDNVNKQWDTDYHETWWTKFLNHCDNTRSDDIFDVASWAEVDDILIYEYNGKFEKFSYYPTGIIFDSDEHLIKFLLKWS